MLVFHSFDCSKAKLRSLSTQFPLVKVDVNAYAGVFGMNAEFDFIVVGTGAGGGRIVLGLVNEIYHLNLYARIKIWFDQAQLEAQNSSNVTIPNRATSLSVAQV